MSLRQFDTPIDRRTVETALAVVVFLLALVLFVDVPVALEPVLSLWRPATMVVPGLLALSVLVGVSAHAVRLASRLTAGEDRTRPGDAALSTVLASLVLGVLAAYTLWWAVAGLYVVFLAEAGGVMIAPLFAVIFGSVLGVLVILRTVVARLFPDGLPARLRGAVRE